MKIRIAFLALSLAVSLSHAAEEKFLVNEDFEQSRLESMPSGWKKLEAANLSIIAEKDHGKVLKIINKTGQSSGLEIRFDPQKVAGKILEIKADGKLLTPYEKNEPKRYAGPKIHCYAKSSDGSKPIHLNIMLKPSDTDWTKLEARFIVPSKAMLVTVGPCIELSACDALFDNFTVSILQTTPPPAMPENPPPVAQTPAKPEKKPDEKKEPQVDGKDLMIKVGDAEKGKKEAKPDSKDDEKALAEIARLESEAEKLLTQAAELKTKADELKAGMAKRKGERNPQDE